MALNFPSAPSNGDTFENYVYDATDGVWKRVVSSGTIGNLSDVTISSPANEQALVYNSGTGNWINADVAGGVEVSATAPVAPSAGDLWWNSTEGDLFVYYNDGTSSQWVPASGPKVTVQGTAPTGYDGQLWLDSTDGSMYVYYTDPGGASSSWIGAVSRSGGVLQVVSTTTTDAFSTASTSLTDVTGLSVDITPRSTSSKILINVDMAGIYVSSTGGAIYFDIARDGAPIGGATTSFSRIYPNDATGDYPLSMSYLDSPSSTSTLTYNVRTFVTSGLTGTVNRNGNNSTFFASTITAIEVAG